MSTYKELLAQMRKLDAEIAAARNAEATAALANIRAQIAEFGFTAQQVFPWKPPKVKTKGEAKYRDPATGNTWSGRGKPPKWLQGQDRLQFAIVG